MNKSNVINALQALAQDKRLDIFRLLVEKGAEGYKVGVIGEKLGIPHSTLSFHLDKLCHAGLITGQKKGRATIYSANYDVLVGTIRYLNENCCKQIDMDCRIEIKENTHC